MLMESGMGCCCQKEDTLFWKNRHIDAMKQLVQVRQENLELREHLGDLKEKLDKATSDYTALLFENDNLKSQLAGAKAQCENTVENRQRISELSREVVNLREQQKNAAKSYARLATERNNLAETISRMEKTIRDLDKRNGTLREHLAQTNASLKRSIQKESQLQSDVAYLRTIRESLAKEIERLRAIVDTPNGSCSAYTQQGMQSKIAKQAAEIKRLTGDNIRLKNGIESLNKRLNELSYQNAVQNANVSCAMDEIKRLTEENKQLHKALDIAAKDADANFERGKIKGMTEIWKELVDCYDGRTISENNKIFGYHTVGDMLMNLTPTWFMNKAREYHEQKEEEARDIQIGDEVEIFDQFDHSLSDIGIVIAISKDNPCFAVIGPNFEGCFDETDIQSGNVRKTGQHFDSIPLNYFT